ncbi:MAG: cation:proton antiporter [Calditrichaceae bacterium]|nr:cation:proton antiporter [Calditrichaceae bacterium]
MEIPLLNDIVIIFGLAIIVLFICHRLHIPVILGFLITGMLVGPYGLALVKEIHNVEILAEIGVVLLLFTIGIEFSFKKLLQIKKTVLIGGPLQVLLTFTAAFFLSRYFDLSIVRSVFMGFLIALSSTAIVLKLIQGKSEMDSPHGRATLGILIFQDIIVVPMILITPILAGTGGATGTSLLVLLAKGIGIILLVIISAKWIIPKLLYQVIRTRDNELFILSLVVVCFSVAWLTSIAGLSLALGAFLAGLIISESEYSHHALGNILPFRDIFTTFFFVSIGMMLNVQYLVEQIGIVSLLAFSLIIIKAVIACTVTLLLGYSLRTAIIVGCALAQIGEFSFILAGVGREHGFLAGDIYQRFLAVTILTMAFTPFMIAFAPRLTNLVLRLPFPKRLHSGKSGEEADLTSKKTDHLVIIGFGLNGKNLAHAAKATNIPYAIIEMNSDTVREERVKGEPIVYGDASHKNALDNVYIKNARVAVVAINDATATRQITQQIRRLNPTINLFVRTRFVQEVEPLKKLGADEVIPEEFETSIEIFARVLSKYLIPRNEIDKIVSDVRANNYNAFRSFASGMGNISDLKQQLMDVDISAIRIEPGSALIGMSIIKADLRKKYGISIIAVKKGEQILTNPAPSAVLNEDDVVYLLGSPDKITESQHIFSRQKNS